MVYSMASATISRTYGKVGLRDQGMAWSTFSAPHSNDSNENATEKLTVPRGRRSIKAGLGDDPRGRLPQGWTVPKGRREFLVPLVGAAKIRSGTRQWLASDKTAGAQRRARGAET